MQGPLEKWTKHSINDLMGEEPNCTPWLDRIVYPQTIFSLPEVGVFKAVQTWVF